MPSSTRRNTSEVYSSCTQVPSNQAREMKIRPAAQPSIPWSILTTMSSPGAISQRSNQAATPSRDSRSAKASTTARSVDR